MDSRYGPRDTYDQLWNLKGPMERQALGGYEYWRATQVERDQAINAQVRKAKDADLAQEIRAITEEMHAACPMTGCHVTADAMYQWENRLAAVAARLEE